MNKLIASLIVGAFSAAAFATTPVAPVATPATAAPAVAASIEIRVVATAGDTNPYPEPLPPLPPSAVAAAVAATPAMRRDEVSGPAFPLSNSESTPMFPAWLSAVPAAPPAPACTVTVAPRSSARYHSSANPPPPPPPLPSQVVPRIPPPARTRMQGPRGAWRGRRRRWT